MATKYPKFRTDNLDTTMLCSECGTQIKNSEEKPILTQTLEVLKEDLSTSSTFAGRHQLFEGLGKEGIGKSISPLIKRFMRS